MLPELIDIGLLGGPNTPKTINHDQFRFQKLDHSEDWHSELSKVPGSCRPSKAVMMSRDLSQVTRRSAQSSASNIVPIASNIRISAGSTVPKMILLLDTMGTIRLKTATYSAADYSATTFASLLKTFIAASLPGLALTNS